MSKYHYTDEQFIEAVQSSKSIAEICRKIGIADKGGNYKVVHKKIDALNLDTSHLTGRAWNQGKRYRQIVLPKSLDEILTENSYYQTNRLKGRLIKEGLKEHKCEKCGRKEWENEIIPLELHHIDGNPSNNRLENLQLLCPNCHALTENFRGKNKSSVKNRSSMKDTSLKELSSEDLKIHEDAKKLAKRRKIKISEAEYLIRNSPNQSIEDFPRLNNSLSNKICPVCNKEFHPKNKEQIYCSVECAHKSKSKIVTREEFLESIIKFNANFTQLGKYYGVSDKTITKWCTKYELPSHKYDLLEYIKNI